MMKNTMKIVQIARKHKNFGKIPKLNNMATFGESTK